MITIGTNWKKSIQINQLISSDFYSRSERQQELQNSTTDS